MHNIARGIVATLTVAIVGGLGLAQAGADTLDDRRAELQGELASASDAVEQASARVGSAVAALDDANRQLSAAEERLAQAEAATVKARELDVKRQQELAAAEHKVKQAEADVAAAQAAYDSVDARVNEEITVITQQSGPLVQLALLVTDIGMADLNHRAQLSETLLDGSALELDELQARRLELESMQAAAEAARTEAENARKAAAEQLQRSEELQAAADQARDEVAQLAKTRDSALSSAEVELEAERQRQAALEAESADVDKRIAQRIAEEEARRQAEEAARRKEQASRAAAARKAPAAASPAHRPAAKPAKPAKRPATGGSVSNSSGFMLPVNGRLSSPYGMRVHPVLGYKKLHDGTDIAASCGTPIRAAGSGRVAERYFNAGYGNRLMIDHGRIGGSYVTTGYNHASNYTVSVGQQVSKGQIIGYVGTTGYSTGCHLHLMVWENGKVVNAMAKWFR